MRHEQPAQAVTHAAGNPECLHLLRQGAGADIHRQSFQRRDHFVAAGQLGAARIGTEFAPARKPHRDDAGQHAEHHVQHENHRVIADTRAAFVAIRVEKTIDHSADQPREHNHKRVQYALQQRHRDHIAIGDMTDFMRQHRFGFAAIHRPQQTHRHGHQGLVAIGAGGERVDLRCIVNSDFRHADARGFGLTAYGLHQPALDLAARLDDHMGAGGFFSDPFRQHQRNDRTAKTEHRGHHQQTGVAARINTEHRHHHTEQHEHGEIGGEEQRDTFEHDNDPCGNRSDP